MVFAVVWHDDHLHPPSRVSSIPQGRLLALEIHSTCRGAARDAPPSGAKPDSISIRLQQNQLHISNFDEDEHLELFFNSFVRSASHHLTASSSSRAPSDSCPKFEYRNLATGRPMLLSFFYKNTPMRVQQSTDRTIELPSPHGLHRQPAKRLWSRRRQTQSTKARYPSTPGYATAQ